MQANPADEQDPIEISEDAGLVYTAGSEHSDQDPLIQQPPLDTHHIHTRTVPDAVILRRKIRQHKVSRWVIALIMYIQICGLGITFLWKSSETWGSYILFTLAFIAAMFVVNLLMVFIVPWLILICIPHERFEENFLKVRHTL